MIKRLLIGAVFLTVMLVLGLIGYIGIILAGEYVIDETKLVLNSSSRLVDEDGNVLSKLYIENRELVDIDNIPDHVQHAFIAVEDSRFYQHHGIDVQAILRALYKDILAGGKVEGGSTITQQLAKNVFLSNEKTLLRKTKEAVIAINLERHYSKDKLLEMYLNQIYFGHGAYGIQAASNLYFDKDVAELTPEEGAVLAAIPKAPSTYSPVVHPDKNKARRDLILSLMGKQGYLEPDQVVRLQGKTLAVSVNKTMDNPAYSTYIDMVLEEAEKRYHLSNDEVLTGGYDIVVPMNRTIQQTSYELFQDASNFPGTDDNVQGAFVLLDVKTGGVLAVQGGRDYVHKGLNRVKVNRQPGSVIKPLAVYGPALEEGKYHPYSLLVDKPLQYGDYQPENYDDQYDGSVTMYDALLHSDNAPAVWLLNELGIDVGKKYLKKAGMSIEDDGLAIALGGLKEGVTPFQIASAFRALANGGKVTEPFFIKKIIDRNGESVATLEQKERKVFSKQTSWFMTKMLQAVVSDGTAKAGRYQGVLAGKTGTTSFTKVEGAAKDAWFAGYTPNAVGALWMGYDRTTEKQYLKSGSSYATSLFKEILSESDYKSEMVFHRPEGVKDLDKPIRLPKIEDVRAKIIFRPLDLLSVRLTWTPSEDERVVYRIYEKTDHGKEMIGSVRGEGSFIVEDFSIFDAPEYEVVPFNEQIKKEGSPSNSASVDIFSGRKLRTTNW